MTGTAAATVGVWSRCSGGLATGLVAVALVMVAVLAGRRRWTPPPVAGLVLAAAALVALDRAGPTTLVDDRLRLGVLLLAVGPSAVALLGAVRPVEPALCAWLMAGSAVPGALVTADAAAGVAPRPWVGPLVVVTVVVGGAGVTATDRITADAGPALVCLVGTLVACFTTVPDTEQAGVLAGVALPFVLLGAPGIGARVGPGGYAVVGLLAWTAAVGGVGRPGSALGAVAGLGILLTIPVARVIRGSRLRLPRRPGDARWSALVVIQVVVVVGTARVAGLRESLTAAAVVAGPVLALTVPAVVAVGTPGRNDPSDPAPYHGGG